jgi:hypothetical protein
MQNYLKNLSIIILIIFASILVYKVHLNYSYPYQDPHEASFIVEKQNNYYPYPLHGDEWTHLAQATYLIENKKIPELNPYLKDSGNKLNLESGFHSFLAQFFTLTKLDPILNYQYLPAIILIISLLSIILLIMLITNNFYISLLSSLFFLSIKNNVNLMGVWFLVPLTFSIFIIYLFFYCFLHKNKRLKYLSILFYLASLFVYPAATVLTTLILVIYLLINKKLNKYHLILLSILILASLVLFRNNLQHLLDVFIFRYGWTGAFEFNYSIIKMYGLVAFLLALIGLIYTYTKKLNKILIIWPLICSIPVLMYPIVKFTLFLPYQRAFFYLLISLAPLSAVGLSYLVEYVHNLIKRYDKIAAVFIIIIVTIFIFINQFNNYYRIDDKRFLPLHFINEDDYQALKWVKNSYGGGNLVMANLLTAFGVYPISQNYVVAMPLSNLQGGNENLVNQFYDSDCQTKENILIKNKINLVYNYNKINCTFLKEVYDKNVYVYEAI